MKHAQTLLRYGLGQGLIPVFAYVVTWYPEYASPLYIAYLVIVMAVSYVMMMRSMRRVRRAASEEEIRRGKELYKAKAKEVQSLMLKDSKLSSELGAQLSGIFLVFISMVIMVVAFPVLSALVNGLTEPKTINRFIGNIALYETFFLISVVSNIAMRVTAKRRGFSTLVIPTEYVVTDKGIVGKVGKQKLALKFPIKAKRLAVNVERSFVELDTDLGTSSPSAPPSRLRLYARRPEELYEVLKSRAVPE